AAFSRAMPVLLVRLLHLQLQVWTWLELYRAIFHRGHVPELSSVVVCSAWGEPRGPTTKKYQSSNWNRLWPYILIQISNVERPSAFGQSGQPPLLLRGAAPPRPSSENCEKNDIDFLPPSRFGPAFAVAGGNY